MKILIHVLRFACLDAFRHVQKSESHSAAEWQDSLFEENGDSVAKGSRTCGWSVNNTHGSLHHYRFPRSQNNDLVIGACRGTGFDTSPTQPREATRAYCDPCRPGGIDDRSFHQIRALKVWKNAVTYHIMAIWVVWDDGHVDKIGSWLPAGGHHHFIFEPGEHLVGDLILRGDGHMWFKYLGGISFKTNLGRSYVVGKTDTTKYYFPSGDGQIRSFFGISSWGGINCLGVSFWHPVSNVRLTNFVYPTLSSLPHLSAPNTVGTRVYCNASPRRVSSPKIEKKKIVKHGKSFCLEGSFSAKYGSTLTVSARLPTLVEQESEASWEVSASASSTSCSDTTTETEDTLTWKEEDMLPWTRWEAIFSQWSTGLQKLPFSATLLITFRDGRTKELQESGFYKGVSNHALQFSIVNYTTITSCD